MAVRTTTAQAAAWSAWVAATSVPAAVAMVSPRGAASSAAAATSPRAQTRVEVAPRSARPREWQSHPRRLRLRLRCRAGHRPADRRVRIAAEAREGGASPWPGTRPDRRSCAADRRRAKPDPTDRQIPTRASAKRSRRPGRRASTAPSRSAVPTPRRRRRHRAAPEMAGEARSWGEGEGHGTLGSCYENSCRSLHMFHRRRKGSVHPTNADVQCAWTKISRSLAPFGGPTMPRFSINSTILAARL